MYSKILVFAFVASCQVVLAQRPTAIPNPLGVNPLGGFGANPLNPLGVGVTPPFFGGLNTNWVRPYYTAAADGWRTYFEQLQQARNQLFNTLTNIQTTNQNATSGAARNPLTSILSVFPLNTKHANDDAQILGEPLTPPPVEVPVQHQVQETQIVTTVTRPQAQSEIQQVRPQGHVPVTQVAQEQTGARHPQGVQTVTTATRPVTSTITTTATRPVTSTITSTATRPLPGSNVVLPGVGGQIIPQIGNPISNWLGK